MEVNGRHYQKNRRHLIQTSETELSDPPDDTPSAEDRTNQEPVETEQTSETETSYPPVRRSDRVRKSPRWMSDYVRS